MSAPALLDDPDAIVGASGAGKSYTGRRKVEQLLEAGRHVIIFDPTGVWYGLQSDAAGTGPGFDVPVFGGPHANLPIGAGQGAAVARILLEERASAVLDLSQFADDDLRGFALDFLEPLRRRERVNLHLVFDEAEEFAPQTAPDDVGFQLVRQMTWIAKRGRVFGLVPTFITQRPADFAKAVLSQVQTLYFHQLIAPADQAPVKAYLRANADKATLQAVESSLPSLERGERWVYSPRAQLLERGRTPAIATFDSMATPAPGEAKRAPRVLAELDVSKIRAALAPPAPASDPSIPTDPEEAYQVGTAAGQLLIERDRRIAELGSQVAELAAELEEREAECEGYSRKADYARLVLDAALEGKDVPSPPIYADGTQLRLAPSKNYTSAKGAGVAEEVRDTGASSALQSQTAGNCPLGPGGTGAAGEVIPPPSSAATDIATFAAKAKSPRGATIRIGGPPADVWEPLNEAAREFAQILKVDSTASWTWNELALVTVRRPGSGYLGKARKALLVDREWVEHADGEIHASDALCIEPGIEGALPPGPAELVTRWADVLRGPGGDILRELARSGPASREELGRRIDKAHTSGWFGKGMKDLTRSNLVVRTGDRISLVPLLRSTP